MNEALEKLYSSMWDDLKNIAIKENLKSASPLLIKVDEKYVKSDVKVMVVGQETDGWFGVFSEKLHSVDVLMNGYYDYFYKISKDGKKQSSRPFWNKKNFGFFENKLKSYFEIEGRSVEFVWSNISKIGNVGGRVPSSSVRKVERKFFNVFRKEVEILNPDIIIFTTGSRDGFIKHHFGKECEFIPKLCFDGGKVLAASSNLLAEVTIPSFEHICAVRVQHPNRRALSNDIILSVIKDCWERKNP